MKHKILAVLVASALLSACGDNKNETTTPATSTASKAIEGPVQGMQAQLKCDGGINVDLGKTDKNGEVKIDNPTYKSSPEKCSVTYTATSTSYDVLNSKLITASYTVAKGTIKAGQKAVATPITTLIAKQITDANQSPADAKSAVFLALGLDGLSVAQKDQMLNDPEGLISSLAKSGGDEADLAKKLRATTTVLSDYLATTNGGADATVDNIANSTKTTATKVASDATFKSDGSSVVTTTASAADIKGGTASETPTVAPGTALPESGNPATGGTGGTGGGTGG